MTVLPQLNDAPPERRNRSEARFSGASSSILPLVSARIVWLTAVRSVCEAQFSSFFTIRGAINDFQTIAVHTLPAKGNPCSPYWIAE